MEIYKAQSPCSFMVFGEYDVLNPLGQAIVLSVHPTVDIELAPLPHSSKIEFLSHVGCEEIVLGDWDAVENPFLRSSLHYFNPCVGCKIHVLSSVSTQTGFGTSAAFTVSLVKLFKQWLTPQDASQDSVFQAARFLTRQAQGGSGSGADVAASVFEGCIHFQDGYVKHLPYPPFLYAHYVGYKTKTIDMIRCVQEKSPHISLFEAMNACTEQAILAFESQEWETVGKLMNVYHGLLSALGVSNLDLENLVYTFRAHTHVLGSKISGSGLGDCVIALSQKRIESQEEVRLHSK